MIGQSISHYRVLARLGGGGMGVVYHAEDLSLGRPVALKFLSDKLTGDVQALERFRREARAASALNHPNICTVYEIGEHEGAWFIAMELLEGSALDTHLGGRPLSSASILDYSIQIVEALAAAHARGIVHRDIKPANLFVTRSGLVKILDFGLAKYEAARAGAGADGETIAGEEPSLTAPGQHLGTAAYMSPEQARGEVVDSRSDLFSFGAVLYEMSTGRRAFPGNTAPVVHDAVLNRNPAAVIESNPGAPPELARIIGKALEKDRDLRYQSAQEMLADLKRARRDSQSASSGAAPPAPLRPSTNAAGSTLFGAGANTSTGQRSGLAKQAGLLLAILAVLGVAIYVAWSRRSGSSVPSPSTSGAPAVQSLAVLPFRALSSGEGDATLGLGIADTVITKVSQLGKVTVRPTSAVTKYARQDADALAAAAELKVDAVLDGTVQRSGDRLRVSVNLLRVADGASLWADSFDMAFTDIFSIQDLVSQQVAARLRLHLTPDEQARLGKRHTSNAEAHRYFVEAKTIFDPRPNGAEIRRAIGLFEKAVESDPNYALARSQLAYAYLWMGLLIEPTNATWVQHARQELQRAESLDPNLAEIHVVRHELLWSVHGGFRIAEAIRELRRAQELNPAVGAGELGVLYAHVGLEPQAFRELRQALEIEPDSRINQSRFGESVFLTGTPEEGYAAMDRFGIREAFPALRISRDVLPRAQQAVEAGALGYTSREVLGSMRGVILALQGRFSDAESAIPPLTESIRVNRAFHHFACNVATVYALQGKSRQAVEWLRKAVETGMPNYPMFARDPNLGPIRDEPEFVQFMSELKPQWEAYNREFR